MRLWLEDLEPTVLLVIMAEILVFSTMLHNYFSTSSIAAANTFTPHPRSHSAGCTTMWRTVVICELLPSARSVVSAVSNRKKCWHLPPKSLQTARCKVQHGSWFFLLPLVLLTKLLQLYSISNPHMDRDMVRRADLNRLYLYGRKVAG